MDFWYMTYWYFSVRSTVLSLILLTCQTGLRFQYIRPNFRFSQNHCTKSSVQSRNQCKPKEFSVQVSFSTFYQQFYKNWVMRCQFGYLQRVQRPQLHRCTHHQSLTYLPWLLIDKYHFWLIFTSSWDGHVQGRLVQKLFRISPKEKKRLSE